MYVKFGNLTQPRHSEDPKKPEAEEKISEMMGKLHEAGYVRQDNIRDGVKGGKFYHIFDLPHSMEFGDTGEEALEIMRPYSGYMKPLSLVAALPNETKREDK